MMPSLLDRLIARQILYSTLLVLNMLVAKTGRPFTDAKTGDKFVALQDGTLY